MNLKGVKDILEAEMLCGDDCLDDEVEIISASDLLSEVLAFAKPGSMLLTSLINPQVMRTAEMVEISAICFVRGRMPTKETIELAKENGIPLICTKLPMYETCGRLYRIGIAGCSEYECGDGI